MDYDHAMTNSAANPLSTASGNNFSYVPSFYPESLYVAGTATNSLIDPTYYSSSESSRFSNFSSEPHMPSNVSHNMRYHPYRPRFTNYKGINYNRQNACYFNSCDGLYGSETAGKCFCSEMNCQQKTKMGPKMYKEKGVGKANHFKPNMKKVNLKTSRKTNIMPKGNFPALIIENNPQSNHDNSVFNCIQSTGVLMDNEDENRFIDVPVTNETNYVNGNTYTNEEIAKANIGNTEASMNNLNETEDKNFIAYAANDIGVISENQNDQLVNVNNEREDVSSIDLIFADEITGKDMNNCQLLSNSDLSGYQVVHITLPENIYSNSNIQRENLENTETKNYFLNPIFKGKDENGQDILLLASSDMQQVENKANICIDNENLETQNYQEDMSILTENNTLKNESSPGFQSHAQSINEHDITEFFSHINDYASEEIVTTSNNESFKTKICKQKNNENTDEKSDGTEIQTTQVKYARTDSITEPSTSKNSGDISTYMGQNVNQSHKNINSRQRKRQKKRFQWKSNEPLSNIQHAYLQWIMKKVRAENEHMMMNENFWTMYKIIVHKIGGSVLKTVYDVLPELIENSGVSMRKSKNVASKKNKKRLQVKLQAKMKKQDHSKI